MSSIIPPLPLLPEDPQSPTPPLRVPETPIVPPEFPADLDQDTIRARGEALIQRAESQEGGVSWIEWLTVISKARLEHRNINYQWLLDLAVKEQLASFGLALSIERLGSLLVSSQQWENLLGGLGDDYVIVYENLQAAYETYIQLIEALNEADQQAVDRVNRYLQIYNQVILGNTPDSDLFDSPSEESLFNGLLSSQKLLWLNNKLEDYDTYIANRPDVSSIAADYQAAVTAYNNAVAGAQDILTEINDQRAEFGLVPLPYSQAFSVLSPNPQFFDFSASVPLDELTAINTTSLDQWISLFVGVPRPGIDAELQAALKGAATSQTHENFVDQAISSVGDPSTYNTESEYINAVKDAFYDLLPVPGTGDDRSQITHNLFATALKDIPVRRLVEGAPPGQRGEVPSLPPKPMTFADLILQYTQTSRAGMAHRLQEALHLAATDEQIPLVDDAIAQAPDLNFVSEITYIETVMQNFQNLLPSPGIGGKDTRHQETIQLFAEAVSQVITFPPSFSELVALYTESPPRVEIENNLDRELTAVANDEQQPWVTVAINSINASTYNSESDYITAVANEFKSQVPGTPEEKDQITEALFTAALHRIPPRNNQVTADLNKLYLELALKSVASEDQYSAVDLALVNAGLPYPNAQSIYNSEADYIQAVKDFFVQALPQPSSSLERDDREQVAEKLFTQAVIDVLARTPGSLQGLIAMYVETPRPEIDQEMVAELTSVASDTYKGFVESAASTVGDSSQYSSQEDYITALMTTFKNLLPPQEPGTAGDPERITKDLFTRAISNLLYGTSEVFTGMVSQYTAIPPRSGLRDLLRDYLLNVADDTYRSVVEGAIQTVGDPNPSEAESVYLNAVATEFYNLLPEPELGIQDTRIELTSSIFTAALRNIPVGVSPPLSEMIDININFLTEEMTILTQALSGVLMLRSSRKLIESLLDDEEFFYLILKRDITLPISFVKQDQERTSKDTAINEEGAKISAQTLGPHSSKLQVLLANALLKTIFQQNSFPLPSRVLSIFQGTVLDVLGSSSLQIPEIVANLIANVLDVEAASNVIVALAIAMALHTRLIDLVRSGALLAYVNSYLEGLAASVRTAYGAALQNVQDARKRLEEAQVSGDEAAITMAGTVLADAESRLRRLAPLYETFGIASVGQLASLSRQITGALSLSILILDLAVFGRSLGLPGLAAQMLANSLGLPENIVAEALRSGGNIADVFDNPISIFYLKQSLTDILAAESGLSLEEIENLINTAINNVLVRGGIETFDQLFDTFAVAFQEQGLSEDQANALAEQAVSLIRGDVGIGFLEVAFERNFDPATVSFAVIENLFGTDPEKAAALLPGIDREEFTPVLQRAIERALQGEGLQTQRDFRDRLAAELGNVGLSTDHALFLANNVTGYLVTGQPVPLKEGLSGIDGIGALINLLSPGSNPLLVAGGDALTKEELAQRIGAHLLATLTPSIGQRKAREFRDRVLIAFFGTASIEDIADEEKRYPLSLYNQIRTQVEILRETEEEEYVDRITQELVELVATLLTPNALTGYLIETLGDHARTFIGNIAEAARKKTVDIPI